MHYIVIYVCLFFLSLSLFVNFCFIHLCIFSINILTFRWFTSDLLLSYYSSRISIFSVSVISLRAVVLFWHFLILFIHLCDSSSVSVSFSVSCVATLLIVLFMVWHFPVLFYSPLDINLRPDSFVFLLNRGRILLLNSYPFKYWFYSSFFPRFVAFFN